MRFHGILLLLIIIAGCTKVTETENLYQLPGPTYAGHQFKDKRSILQIGAALEPYLGNAGVQALQLQYGVTVYRVRYQTKNYQGEPLIASGLVYFPDLRYFFVPVISYQHGTAISKGEVPSITADLDYYVPFVLASESGAIVCAPDYIGMGFSEGVHHYFEPTEEANAVLDLIRSICDLLKKTYTPLTHNRDVFLMGYSQGGHATLAAQKAMETNRWYEYNLKASAPMAGFFSLTSSSQFDVLTDSIDYPFPAVYPFLINSIQDTRKVFPNNQSIYVSPYDSLSNVLFNGNYNAAYVNAQFPAAVGKVFQSSFLAQLRNANSAFYKAAASYDVIDGWAPSVPTRFYHSEADEVAFYDNSVIVYQTFKNKGGNVDLINLGNVNHLDGNIAALEKVRAWFYPQIRKVAY